MRLIILFLLSLSTAWAKPLVMISFYDAFSGAPLNSSEIVAKELLKRFNKPDSPVEVKLCLLNTVFDKSYSQLERCLRELPETPVMVLGLGEAGCELKVETMMRNMDRTIAPDNAGIERNNSVIIPSAPYALGLRYPLAQMYCSLSKVERQTLNVSNNAGSFVCNNTAYQMSYHYPELQFGFIHVPAHFCRNLVQLMDSSILMLEKMIKGAVGYLSNDKEDLGFPHPGNELRLSTTKAEIKRLKRQYKDGDPCLSEFLNRTKGADEKRTFLGVSY